MKKVILASASPRRRELLSLIVPDFEILVSDAEEVTDKQLPYEVVEDLSFIKASNVYRIVKERYGNNTYKEPVIIIGSDTVVSIDNEILGKPCDENMAYSMLSKLQGQVHEVYTGVTIISYDGENETVKTFNECTKVHFYPMTENEIGSYVATGDCVDKAGAYGIQSGAAVYIEKIDGDYNNVVGLPVARLYHELRDM